MKLHMGCTCTFQQDNNQKHNAKSTLHFTAEKSEVSGVAITLSRPQYQ